MAVRPTGTVTFLFSDIEGSTARWERDSDVMATALARHDALMRVALEARGAYIFKTVGDEFCAAFATASDAVAAALDAQRALVAEDFSAVEGIRARMALHTGKCAERDSDYFGPTVNRVARLLAIGYGGQVLLSGACVELVQDKMPAETGLRDLGAHRLRDLAQPERVYQLIAPDLPGAFPELRSLDHLTSNLPAQLTSFVGREEVVAEITALLKEHRLVTLVGTGGAGKTRCAIRVGAELLNGFQDGVWLSELAPIYDQSFVAGTVARVLGVQESLNRPLLETLLAYIKRKRLLLILDNCEHVIGEAGTVAAAVLRGCPEVRILTTSREGLNIAGEQLYRMPALSMPAAGRALTAHDALSFGAPLLFADRACLADSRFALDDENAEKVAEICRRLDGIPLAIELAAATVKFLSLQQLGTMLDERFRVLTRGDRSALPRHQTMRALIDWSYDLLSENERTLFRKLSIFAGGFTLEMASAVCISAGIDETTVLNLLESLIDKSLVQAEVVKNGARYRLLESTRQYAQDRLAESGDHESVARAHATAFLALAENLERTWEVTTDRVWLAQAEPELENFRVALRWALEARHDVLLGQRLAGTLRWLWAFLGAVERLRSVQSALQLVSADTPPPVVAALDLAEATLASRLVQHNVSHAAAERALRRYSDLRDPLRIANARLYVGFALVHLERVAEAHPMLEQALAGARDVGAGKLAGNALAGLANARSEAGDPSAARALYAEALAVARASGAERSALTFAANLAETELQGGDAMAALRLARESLAAYRAFNDTSAIAPTLSNATAYLVALGRFEEARELGREALGAARAAQFHAVVAWALQHLAAVGALARTTKAQRREERERAGRLLGYVDGCLTALGAPRDYTEQQEYDAMLPALRNALGEEKLAMLLNEGGGWNEDQAADEAMLI
jgi:predicted ATPase/class 3 adenylate cyclase